jgi:two-component system nitrate/nitrite response regulator NarL
LEISEHTVKFHVNAILGKLDAQSRTEAAIRAAALGLILI